MNGFVLLSDGNNVVIKSGDDQSYKFTGCIMTGVSMDHQTSIDSVTPSMSISIELIASDCEHGEEIDLSANNKLCELLECVGFGQSIRKLDI